MGLFDFIKKYKVKTTEVALKREEDYEYKSKMGVGNIRHQCLVCRADVALCYRAVQNPDCRLAG